SGNEELTVAEDGTLYMQTDGVSTEIGRLNIYMPTNLETLQPAGENYFLAPDNNLMVVDNARIQSNMIEMSNVNLDQDMTNMILAQRANSLNVKVAQSTDEIMSIINQFSV